jgi:hypothetical protein
MASRRADNPGPSALLAGIVGLTDTDRPTRAFDRRIVLGDRGVLPASAGNLLWILISDGPFLNGQTWAHPLSGAGSRGCVADAVEALVWMSRSDRSQAHPARLT